MPSRTVAPPSATRTIPQLQSEVQADAETLRRASVAQGPSLSLGDHLVTLLHLLRWVGTILLPVLVACAVVAGIYLAAGGAS